MIAIGVKNDEGVAIVVDQERVDIDRVSERCQRVSGGEVDRSTSAFEAVSAVKIRIEQIHTGQKSLSSKIRFLRRREIAFADVAPDADARRMNAPRLVRFVGPKQIVDPRREIVAGEIALAEARSFLTLPIGGQ